MIQTSRVHNAATVLAETTTAAGAVDTAGDSVRLPAMANAIVFTLDVTAAATDAADTLDVQIETKLDGTNWVPVVHFTQVLGNGGAKTYVEKISAGLAESGFESAAALAAGNVRNLLGDEYRAAYVQVDGDANGSFTFTVKAVPM